MGSAWRNPRFRNGWKSFEGVVRRKLETIQRSPSAGNEYEWDRLFQESLHALERHRASGYTWDIFQTFRSVIVRVYLPKGSPQKLPKLILDERSLTLSGIPGKLDETIELPVPISPRKPQAVYAKGIVEIRIRKKNMETSTERVRCSRKKSPPGS
jgi:HSP20 family molecular chaperone IbpA